VTFHVIVVDRDAGWAVEKHGPFPSHDVAATVAKTLRRMHSGLTPARGNLHLVESARDQYDVRIIQHDNHPTGDAA